MARPIKWSRDVHPIRERAAHSRTETWSRKDIERLFGIGRASAQNLMKAIGEVQTVAGAHFVDRASLLGFLDHLLNAESVDEALRDRQLEAEPPPRPKTLRVSLPGDLRSIMLPDLPPNVRLEPGRVEILADTAVGMVETLVILAMVMQNDLDRWRNVIEPPAQPPAIEDKELRRLFEGLRR